MVDKTLLLVHEVILKAEQLLLAVDLTIDPHISRHLSWRMEPTN